MELTDLHIFRTVALAGGITRAAERLHRVQSNVTTRIKHLEEELGVALFLREGRGMVLSPAGATLLDYAERLLDLAAEARLALQNDTPRGRLRLGSMESTAAARLPLPLSRFHEAFPEVALELSTATTGGLLGQVLAGDIDAALVAEPLAEPQLEGERVFREELVVIAAPGHPPLPHLADISGLTFLAFGGGCAYRQRLETLFSTAARLPQRVVELQSYHAIIGCTAAGMGIAMIPRSVLAISSGAQALQAFPLPDGQQEVWTQLVWRRGRKSAAIAALLETLLASAVDAQA